RRRGAALGAAAVVVGTPGLRVVSRPRGAYLPSMLVLVIEDEPDLRELSQFVLEDAGMLVVTVSDGARPLRLPERARPDVIVTDPMMPALDGFGLLEGYRERADLSAPVVAASSMGAYLDEAQRLGVAGVLEKPFAPRDLVEIVRQV